MMSLVCNYGYSTHTHRSKYTLSSIILLYRYNNHVEKVLLLLIIIRSVFHQSTGRGGELTRPLQRVQGRPALTVQ